MIEIKKNREAINLLKKPKAIIFDWDNTLVDTWPLIMQSINATMRAMNQKEWTLEEVRDNVHKSMRESFPEIFGKDWQKAGEIYKNSYRQISNQIDLLPNSLNLINEIKKLGILQFLVSNKIGTTLRKEVHCLKIEDRFFGIVGAQDTEFDKPNIAPVKLALRGSEIDLETDEVWFVGDTIADIDCAISSGCTPILFSSLENKISKTIPKKTINTRLSKGFLPIYFDHNELLEIVKKLNR